MAASQSSFKVPFNEFVSQVAELRPEIDAAIARVLDRAHFILGPENQAFEAAFADYLNVKHVITVANGTDALEIALRALHIGAGDEVICPALTAAPTALAILAAGAEPVFADVDARTCTLDPASLEACLSSKTRAIIPVHLYGLAANMPAIMAFAEASNLMVIEDAAQGHGALIHGNQAGTIAPIGCFSFYPTKNLGAFGDGGAIITNDDHLAGRARQLRDLGQTARFKHDLPGRNSRLDEIQAAVLSVKLRHLDAYNQARRERAGWYAELLADVPDLILPLEPDGFAHVYHLYVAQHPRSAALRAHLTARGIGSDVHYPTPMHKQTVFAGCRIPPNGLPIAEKAVTQILSLPMYPHLTRAQVEVVAAAVRDFAG
jgi:dTDP-4-amino-4,6-dideoxygalactose transaminase